VRPQRDAREHPPRTCTRTNPAISTWIFGYPLAAAAKVAVRAGKAWCGEHESPQRIIFCCYTSEDAAI